MSVYRHLAFAHNRIMSQSSRVMDGVFAVHKPHGISSYDVIRDLQRHFRNSQFFKPWLAAEKARLIEQWRNDRNRRGGRQRKNAKQLEEVKLGHGGTLDPSATGVLITGVGSGTKHLGDFLGCTKTYEAVVLFGVATDSYDGVGKVISRAPYEHVTRDAVEKALEKFRGPIMQIPPIFSALKVQGKKLYEYAREGKKPPVEIAARPVEVFNLEIMEWYPGGTHEYKWPTEEAGENEKIAAQKVFGKEEEGESTQKRKSPPPSSTQEPELARELEQEEPPVKRQKTAATDESTPADSTTTTTKLPSQALPESSESNTTTSTPLPPAVKITMTVSSGFYVRSLSHDLGLAIGSNALMTSLVRTRQGDFDISPENIIEYKDLEGGEEVWGPKLQGLLDKWAIKHVARERGER